MTGRFASNYIPGLHLFANAEALQALDAWEESSRTSVRKFLKQTVSSDQLLLILIQHYGDLLI